jgi:hypothetical protein
VGFVQQVSPARRSLQRTWGSAHWIAARGLLDTRWVASSSSSGPQVEQQPQPHQLAGGRPRPRALRCGERPATPGAEEGTGTQGDAPASSCRSRLPPTAWRQSMLSHNGRRVTDKRKRAPSRHGSGGAGTLARLSRCPSPAGLNYPPPPPNSETDNDPKEGSKHHCDDKTAPQIGGGHNDGSNRFARGSEQNISHAFPQRTPRSCHE